MQNPEPDLPLSQCFLGTAPVDTSAPERTTDGSTTDGSTTGASSTSTTTARNTHAGDGATSVAAAEAPEAPEAPEGAWWLAFEDPALDRLVGTSLRQNLGLRARWQQLETARATFQQARAARFPTLSLTSSLSHGTNLSAIGQSTSTNFNVSLPVSYELDLFLRARDTARAAEHEVRASASDVATLAISTSASVAEAWYDLVEARARALILEEQLRLNQTLLDATMLRFREGLISALDVHQQRQATEATRAQLELVRGGLPVLEQTLASLLGQPRSALDPSLFAAEVHTLPALGATPPVGVPASVVTQRPDVAAAQRRIEAADHRVSAAISARLPRVSVSFTPGYTWFRNEFTGGAGSAFGSGPSTADGITWSAAASLSVPLFDGFAGRANTRLAESNMQSAVENLGQIVIQALVEVEGALLLEQQQRRQVELLREQLAIASDTLESARARYLRGLTEYLNVLSALTSKQSLELSLLSAERQLVSQRIQLYRALGGDWPAELARPEPTRLRDEEDDSRETARRTDRIDVAEAAGPDGEDS